MITLALRIPKECYEVFIHNFVEAHLIYPESQDKKKRNEVLKTLNLGIFNEMKPALLERIEKGELEECVLSDVRACFGLCEDMTDPRAEEVPVIDRERIEYELTNLFYMVLEMRRSVLAKEPVSVSTFLDKLPARSFLKRHRINLMNDKEYHQTLKKYRHLLPFVMGKVLSEDFFESGFPALWDFKEDKLSLFLSTISYFEKALPYYDQTLWDKNAYDALGVNIGLVAKESLPIEKIVAFYREIVKDICHNFFKEYLQNRANIN